MPAVRTNLSRWLHGEGKTCHEGSTLPDHPTILFTKGVANPGCRIYLDPDPTTEIIESFKSGVTLHFAVCKEHLPDEKTCESQLASFSLQEHSPGNSLDLKALYPGISDYSDRIYQLKVPEADSPSDTGFSAMIRLDMDDDQDGLWNDWETEGVDADGNGTIDFKPEKANPYRKDIYVEIDAMGCPTELNLTAEPCHRPSSRAMAEVIKAFSNASVENPMNPVSQESISGITLHILVDDIIPHEETIIWNGAEGIEDHNVDCTQIKNSNNFICKKENWFGTAEERQTPIKLRAKSFVYHYSLWAHSYGNSGGSSGIAETLGNDFLITLGAERFSLNKAGNHHVGNVKEQAGTFMHELGHNLGLRHGGVDDINYKPNYLSIMNYRWQYTWIPNTKIGPRLDYSRQALITLDERTLKEAEGVLGTGDNAIVPVIEGDQTEWCAQPNPRGLPMVGEKQILHGATSDCLVGINASKVSNHWLNWNFSFVASDGQLVETPDCKPISVDLNGGNDKFSWGKCNNSTQKGTEVLRGWNDWKSLIYVFQTQLDN
ncbi:hypothetical protein P4S72_00240 [Vibrio sp. PP-XX7]